MAGVEVIGLVCLAMPASGMAATFAVNTTADGPVEGTCAAGETCTLRDALVAASTLPTEPENAVIVPAGHYVLTEGELVLEGETTRIVGAGARSTIIDGGGASRDFYVSEGTGVFEDLTVTAGAATELGGGPFPGDGGGVLIAEGGSAGIFRWRRGHRQLRDVERRRDHPLPPRVSRGRQIGDRGRLDHRGQQSRRRSGRGARRGPLCARRTDDGELHGRRKLRRIDRRRA